ncbi:hypothetical protein QCA50_019861 [Cerrena zonata]|uniref:DNA-directed RNA polymerase N-terminal domain-containing protein n=1 Tax=Cerrena zonata TaxID=2478898 RepID=A0AAW0FBE5_9APHY
MIPLARRSAHKFETTLLSYSRQSLPRPYRLYTTPTKSAHAQAMPASSHLGSDAPLPYLPPSLSRELSKTKEMTGFLHEHQDLTILPTPLPVDSEDNSTMIFPDTTVQNTISIVEACVHDLHDVPRARTVFERLRRTHKGDSSLQVGLYNAMLDAYIEMAATKQPERRSHWVEDACALYEVMETGRDKVNPTANTTVDMPTPIQLLRAMIDRQIPASLVVSDRAIKTSDEATEAIKHLSKAAVDMNLSKVVNELGMAEVFGTQIPDALDEVPEATPVMRPKKQDEVRAIHAADGSVTDIDVPEVLPQVDHEVPFNLENLRKHLAQVVLARRVLPEDVAARQKLLEESVYDVAVERLKHQAELFDEIGLASKGLGNNDLRKWMWDWHQKLKERIRAETDMLVQDEQKFSTEKQHTRLSPFLTLLKPEKLSLITILELMNQISSSRESRGIKIARALLSCRESR